MKRGFINNVTRFTTEDKIKQELESLKEALISLILFQHILKDDKEKRKYQNPKSFLCLGIIFFEAVQNSIIHIVWKLKISK